MKVDAVIVGARCAGAATALLLARAGARVLLVDKGVYGSDTMSTHALMRGAVLQLHRWGVLPAIVAAGTPPVHSTTFSYRGQDVTVPIEPRFGVERAVRAAPGAARSDAGRCRCRQRRRGQLRCSYRRSDHRRSRARARDHRLSRVAHVTALKPTSSSVQTDCTRRSHSTSARPASSRAGTRRESSTAIGKTCRWTAITGGSRRVRASAPFPPTTAPHVCSRRCRRHAFAPRFTVTPLRHTAG